MGQERDREDVPDGTRAGFLRRLAVRRRSKWFMFCAVLSIVCTGVNGFAAPAGRGASAPDPERRQRKIVIFREGTQDTERFDAVGRHGGLSRRRLARLNALVADIPEQQIKALRRHGRVKAIHDDVPMRGDAITFVPVAAPAVEAYPWGQEAIGVPAARQLLVGLPLAGVRVAVMDTGIDGNHPELQAAVVGGYNAMSGGNPSNYDDDNGHGTHMAGIIAAAGNGQGVIGTVQQTQLVAVKVLDSAGQGYLSDFLNGMEWVMTQNVQVVNMSLSFDVGSPLLEQAIQEMYEAGIIIVASAGNRCKGTVANDSGGDDSGGDDSGGDDSGGDDSGGDNVIPCTIAQDPMQGGVKYPGRYAEVIAVGGVDVNNQRASYSRTGPEVTLVAPGGSSATGKVLSTIMGSQYAYGSGTSQATAHVAGAIATVLQIAPSLTPTQVLTLLQTTATDLGLPATEQGVGLVDVEGMVRTLLGLP
ncbi:MAG: S8 family peptidase [Candidatus Tectimicrobiota bacterium]